MRQVNIGLVGIGTVGGGVFRALQKNADLLASRLGLRLKLAIVAEKDMERCRRAAVPPEMITNDWTHLVADPDIHIIIELIGGKGVARELILAALRAGKPVVTANKALLSAHGEELFAAAAASRTSLYYEASVAGGVPILKVLREALIGNEISSIHGIVNGTCNYILTRMKLEGAEFADVLRQAQQLGFAEAEPSLDIDGHDALHKAGILASLAHGFWVDPKQIHVEGIRAVTKLDIQFAGQLGYTIKLLGIVKQLGSSKAGKPSRRSPAGIQVSVYPTLIPNAHVLASVNLEYNAILVRGNVVGDTLYYGRGAGPDATASAILSDLAEAALDLKSGGRTAVPTFVPHGPSGRVVPIDETISKYYVRLSVIDKPGTLARIATILGRSKIGISSVIQPEGHEGESVPLILMIHDAPNSAMRKALERIAKLNVIRGQPTMIRVESFE